MENDKKKKQEKKKEELIPSEQAIMDFIKPMRGLGNGHDRKNLKYFPKKKK